MDAMHVIGELLRNEDDNIDIAEAALIMEKEINPKINVTKYLDKIDEIADIIAPEISFLNLPKVVIENFSEALLCDYKAVQVNPLLMIYQADGSRKRRNAKNEEEQINNRISPFLLSTLLDDQAGCCASLSILYLAVGRRIGLPLSLVLLPDHAFVRLDVDNKINIEVTNSGVEVTDKEYRYNYTQKLQKPYMTDLSLKQEIGFLFLNRGNVWVLKNDYNHAIDDYTASLALGIVAPIVLSNRGMAYSYLHKYELAIADFDHASEIDPQDPSIYYNRASVLIEMKEYNKANADINEVIKLSPSYARAYYVRGCISSRKKENSKSLSDFDIAIKYNPNGRGFHEARATAYYNIGDYKKAWKDVKRAQEFGYEVNPELLEALQNAKAEPMK